MNDRECVNTIRDFLRTNLDDPIEQYNKTARTFIHTDEPLPQATYPRIRIRKRGPTNNSIISMGDDFMEWRSMVLDIEIWVRVGYKWQDSGGNWLKDEEFIKEYQDKIWQLLKDNGTTIRTTYGIGGLKNMGESEPGFDPTEQFYVGVVPVRVWYFVT